MFAGDQREQTTDGMHAGALPRSVASHILHVDSGFQPIASVAGPCTRIIRRLSSIYSVGCKDDLAVSGAWRRRVRRTPKLETEPTPVMQGLKPPLDQIDNPFG